MSHATRLRTAFSSLAPVILTPVALVAAFTLVFAGCDRTTGARPGVLAELTALPSPPPAEPFPWWNRTTFYEVFVRSFRDSDGDGIGDLRGLIESLDYLNDGNSATRDDLGVTGIWLMPICASPSYHGYDTTDYFQVDPDYGTNEDFRELMAEAHARGIRVIVDLVLNHTSSQHPWFEASKRGPADPYRDWYLWTDTNPGYRGPWGQNVWHWGDTGFFYGVFWGGMPDLNFRNPEVTKATHEAARFWLADMGADGFRLDAIKHLIEDGARQENTGATRRWLRDFHDLTKDVNPEAFTVGEVWSSTEEVVKYIGDKVDVAFEFETAGAILSSARNGNPGAILRAHRKLDQVYPLHQFATFITNHDQERIMAVLAGDEGKARSAAALLLTGPGVPFLYYGEEVGQKGGKPDENIRTPMQWTSGLNAGFTRPDAKPWRAPQNDFVNRNVATQTRNAGSLLSHYRRLAQARARMEALQVGARTEVVASDPRVYAFLRETRAQTVLVIINLSGEALSSIALTANESEARAGVARETLHGTRVSPVELSGDGGFENWVPVETLAPHETYLLVLE